MLLQVMLFISLARGVRLLESARNQAAFLHYPVPTQLTQLLFAFSLRPYKDLRCKSNGRHTRFACNQTHFSSGL
jgi:hypothetical protein